jgi:putative spermidine/putrescine transport system substrate-binding protein
MKRFSVTSGAVVLALLTLAACGGGSDSKAGGSDLDGQRLVYTDYGGLIAEATDKGWLQPFSKKTGVKYVMDAPTELAKVKAMVDAGKTTWDLVNIDASGGAPNCGTLFKKLPAGIDLSGIDPKYITDDCSIPFETQTIGLVYNKKLFGDNPPTSVTDFLDTKKFPGKRIMANYATGGFESLELAAGIPGKDAYPINYDKVKSAIASLGKNLVFHDSLSQEVEIQQSGDFALCMCYLGRSQSAAEQGADIGVAWNSVVTYWQGLYAVKGSKNSAAQDAFMKYIADPANQAGLYKYVAYGSTAKDPVTDAPAKFDPFLASTNASKITDEALFDPKWWIANVDEASSKWADLTTG